MRYLNTFTHDNHVYNLDKVRILMRDKPTVTIDIKELLWVLKYYTPSEYRIGLSKLRHPLLVAKYKGKWTVVDGLHRLEKYRRKGIVEIPCKEVTNDILRKTLIVQKGIFVGGQRFKI